MIRDDLKKLLDKALVKWAKTLCEAKYSPEQSRSDSFRAKKNKAKNIKAVDFAIAPPPRINLGDYASNIAFELAKISKAKPPQIADELKKIIEKDATVKKIVKEIKIEGGAFLNFRMKDSFLEKEFAKKWRPDRTNKKQTVLVEYSAPNIGKLLSIAHLRSTIIGDSIARIYRALGYKVVTDNHLGDWGLQMGILLAAYKRWSKTPPEKISLQELFELYVRFHEAAKAHPELEVRARMETKDLQDESPESVKIWKFFAAKSFDEFQKLYSILGVKFDHILGESTYRKMFPQIVGDALKRGVAKRSDGAIVVPLERWRIPPLIIQKSDSAYLYGTFDLATIHWRQKKFHPSRIIYVVSNEQTLYFEQLFRTAEKLGWANANELMHIKFGMMRGEDLKRLSTRRGEIIPLEDVIDEAIKRAKEVVEKKNPKLSAKEKNDIAKAVGIGALKYNDLSQNRNTDIVFSWDKMLDFNGNSAPYLQYTYARLSSILAKSKIQKTKRGSLMKILNKPEETALIKKILRFPEVIEDAARDYAPNLIANYLWELANLTNAFYEKYPVLKAEKKVKQARLEAIKKASDVLSRGLELLGIETPQRI